EDQQGALRTEVIDQGVDWPAAAGRRDRKRLRNRGRHKLRIVDRAQGHEVDAVRKLFKDIGRDLQAEARFAGTTRSGQCEEPGLLQQLLGLANLVVAPDEARQLCGKVVRRRLERLQRWEILRETFNAELKEAFRLGQVF